MAIDQRLKREIFSRGVRMTHKFGASIKNSDPIQKDTFNPNFPLGLNQRHGTQLHQKERGEHSYRQDPSAVYKANTDTFASFNGPAPDNAEVTARPIPVGTKRRKDTLKTDK
jgi:hypothetical protein